MATVSATVNGALRKIGVLGAGRSPRSADEADTLTTLQGLYRQWISAGMFGRLCDVVPLTDYVASPNQRVYRNDLAVTTITLPELVVGCWQRWDCCRWGWSDEQAYEREPNPTYRRWDATTPRDASVIVVNDAVTKMTADFLYDGHTKEWRSIYDLALADEAPFSFRDPKGLESVLALQIVDEFAGQIGPATTAMAMQFLSSLNHRYSSPRTEVSGVYC